MVRSFTLLFFLLLATTELLGQTQIQMPMPSHSSVFTGNSRGYYFVAPTCFTITGVEVPTEASAGAQSVAIMRFPATPPLYSTTTNTFTTLFLVQGSPISGIIPVDIQVEAGDIIGVMGVRGTANSYAAGPYNSTIMGNTVVCSRLGMQFPLATTAPQQMWTENGGSISRCWIYYDSLLHFNTTATPVSPTQVHFSSNADTSFQVAWDFGDGSPLANADTITHTYTTFGQYNVCAYITTTCGTDTICNVVTVCPNVVPDFDVVTSGMTVTGMDSTVGADSLSWDFGDGTTATGTNPTHTYTTPGTYSVCVTSYLDCGSMDSSCTTVTVCAPPTSMIGIASNLAGTVSFSDSSTFATSWEWDFGDGNTSTSQNPSHTYAASGDYTVCLIVSNLCGADTNCWVVPACLTAPTAAFVSSENFLQVSFTNGSSAATSYLWTFGDGNTDTTANPTHVYAQSGTYTVCLSAMNVCGDVVMICDTLALCAQPSAGYTFSANGLSLNFTNGSAGASSYSWDFGDGSTSTFASPSHTFPAAGVYNVCLMATNACGNTDTTCQSINVSSVGVVNALPGFMVQVTPNPMGQSAQVFVQADGVAGSSYAFVLTDLNGRQVMTQAGTFGVVMPLERKALPAGVYLYQVVAQDAVLGTGRIVME